MGKKTILCLIIVAIALSGAYASLDVDCGIVLEYDTIGFKNGFSLESASVGADVSLKFYFLYLDVTGSYTLAKSRPIRFRASLNAAVDLGKHFRLALGFGNSLSLLRENDDIVPAWSTGITDGNPFDTPLFLRLETSYLSKRIKAGLVFNMATPLILSKNNLPDLFRAFQDKQLRNYYLLTSSFALVVQYRFGQ